MGRALLAAVICYANYVCYIIIIIDPISKMHESLELENDMVFQTYVKR